MLSQNPVESGSPVASRQVYPFSCSDSGIVPANRTGREGESRHVPVSCVIQLASGSFPRFTGSLFSYML
ncbi:MAG: hypothetical protein H6671_13530 [Anaerolineaceae bacterium]|nr:hypothetical protein [Anaerolineaceae bacterium]